MISELLKRIEPLVIANALLFQALWFASVFGASRGIIWPAAIICLVFLVWHFRFAKPHASDVTLVLTGIALGLLIDSTWIQLSIMQFAIPWPSSELAPIWILFLWIGFPLTINHSLALIKSSYLKAAVFGAVGGPFSYFVGRKMGAVEYLLQPLLVSAMLAAVWVITMLLLVKLANRA